MLAANNLLEYSCCNNHKATKRGKANKGIYKAANSAQCDLLSLPDKKTSSPCIKNFAPVEPSKKGIIKLTQDNTYDKPPCCFDAD